MARGKPRGHQHQHQHQQPQPAPQPSDYETDAPQVHVPRPPPRSNDELNLSVLRRHYPGVVAIRQVTPYAVLYAFNIETAQWEKVGIEGTLFICELVPSHNGADRFSVIILNRRGLDNFDLEIKSEEEIEITEEYIIVQADEVYGIWIFSEPAGSTANARIETAEKIQRFAKQATESRKAKGQPRDNGFGQTVDQADESVPMGRQLSLRELFGQQREQDASFSVHNHHGIGQSAVHNQGLWPNPQLQPQLQSQPQPTQNDILGQLFFKAKQDYNGFG